jgi:four helix bundle protein
MANDLTKRTFDFSNSIILYSDFLPKTAAGRNITYQIVRSGTSVGANYRAVQQARSDREFIAKMNIVLEEADETLFWLEIIKSTELINSHETNVLLN